MSDNITLPREVAYEVPLHELLESVPSDARLEIDYADGKGTRFIPVGRLCREAATALRTALAAPEPEPTHPGYILGSHWLETAYSRVCAGEAEADVLRDCGWERVDDAEALRRDAERYRYLRNRDPKEVFDKSGKAAGVWIDWEDDMAGLQLLTGDDADAAIDAAMQEDKT